jgi:hypothetical protein
MIVDVVAHGETQFDDDYGNPNFRYRNQDASASITVGCFGPRPSIVKFSSTQNM